MGVGQGLITCHCMGRRDATIELYRVLLMFCICYLHVLCQGDYRNIWQSSLFQFSVPGFVFISGYFGVHFSLSKVLRLYLVALYAMIAVPLLGGELGNGLGHYLCSVLHRWRPRDGLWFLHAYCIMMVLAQISEKAFDGDRYDVLKNIIPLLLIVFGWGALYNCNHLRFLIPRVDGLIPCSFITLFGAYCVGRFIRVGRVEERMKSSYIGLLTIALIAAILCAGTILGAANTPASILLAACLFVLFKRMQLPVWMRKIVLNLSPMMFLVCCLNGSLYFPGMEAKSFVLINSCKRILVSYGVPLQLTYLISACFIFSLSVIVATPWYFGGKLFRNLLRAFYGKVDFWYDCLLKRMAECAR